MSGNVIADFIAALTFKADLTPLTEAEKKAKEAAQKSVDAWKKVGDAISKVGKAALGASVGLLALIERSTASAAEIEHMAQRYNISAQELQRITYAIGKSGAGPEVLADAFKTLDRQITEARKGAGPAADAFKALGLGADQLAFAGAEERLGRIADRLNKVRDPAHRMKIALDLLGGSADKLVPALSEGSAGLKAAGDEADRLGITLDDKALKAAVAFDAQLNAIKLQVVGFARDIGLELIPKLQAVIKHWHEWTGVIGGLAGAIAGLKLIQFSSQLTNIGLAAAGAQAGVLGLIGVVGSLSYALGTALDNALGLSDALIGGTTHGVRGAPALLSAEDSARQTELLREQEGLQQQVEAGKTTQSEANARSAIIRTEIANLQAEGKKKNKLAREGAALRRFVEGPLADNALADARGALDTLTTLGRQAKGIAGGVVGGAKGIFRPAEKKPKSGGGAKVDKATAAAEAAFAAEHGDELRMLADRFGIGPAAVDSAIKAGASSVLAGDTAFLSRNAALSRLGSSAGVDLTIKKQTDPLMSEIFNDENVPDVQLSSIARGAEPQVLISNITNNFDFRIDQSIAGSSDPARAGDMSAKAIRDYFQGAVAQSTRTAKVLFAR